MARRGSVRWPWYEDQRLGLLGRAAAGELIGGFAPDVVHVHSPLTLGAAARSAARRRRVPVVYTNHYLPANVHPTADRADRAAARRQARRAGRPGRRFDRPGDRVSAATRATAAASAARPGALFDVGFYGYLTAFANRCDRVTAPTATALLLLREHGLRAPSQVVSNGIDLDVYSPGAADESLRRRYALPAGRPLILSVGRLSPEKRADVLIEAVAAQDEADTVLALAGSGPDEGRLRELAARRGVVRAGPLPRLHPRHRPAGPVPAGGRVRDRVRGRAAVPGDDGGDGQRAAGGRRQRGRARRARARGGERLPGPARPGGRRGGSLDLLCRDRELRARMSKSGLRIIADHDRHRLLARWESIYSALAARGTTSEEKDRQR